jgi:pimeloyl-ACP methyl ester carboxylesterase
MDYWDPLLVSFLAATRHIILFDNAGVGQSSGAVADSIKQMAKHVETFLDLKEIKEVDLLGFSLGGMVAQQVALDTAAKGLVRKLALSATSPGRGPEGGDGIVDGDANETNARAGTPETSLENFLKLFYFDSDTSRAAGTSWWNRINERNTEISGEKRTKEAQGQNIMAMGMAMGKWAGGEGESSSPN